MKIFLKILGFIFTSAITIIFASILFILICDSDINIAIRILNKITVDVYITILLCFGLSVLLVFCPIIFKINEAIDERFY